MNSILKTRYFTLKEHPTSRMSSSVVKSSVDFKTSQIIELNYEISNINSSQINSVNSIPEKTISRGSQLWNTTCFEFFWKPYGTFSNQYFEWNFAFSRKYDFLTFKNYRTPCEILPTSTNSGVLEITPSHDQNRLSLKCLLELPSRDFILDAEVTNLSHFNLSVIIDNINQSKQYFALKHLNAEKPDFHLF